MNVTRLRQLFLLDAAFNVLLGVVLLGLVAAPDILGLPRPVLVVVGVLAVANGFDLYRTGRQDRPAPSAVHRAATVDVVFGLAAVLLALVGLAGQTLLARWVIGAVGTASLLVALLKLAGARHTARVVGQPA